MGFVLNALRRKFRQPLRLGRRSISVSDVDVTAIAREVSRELCAQNPDYCVEFVIQEGLTARADAGFCRSRS